MRLLTALACFTALAPAVAQDATGRREIGFGAVVERLDHRDVAISPLRHGGVILGAGAGSAAG